MNESKAFMFFYHVRTSEGISRLYQMISENKFQKQAMKTLCGMAEHRFSQVYNYQCLTSVLYLSRWILIFPLIPFPLIYFPPLYGAVLKRSHGVIILVKNKPLCRGMAWLPFQKLYLSTLREEILNG